MIITIYKIRNTQLNISLQLFTYKIMLLIKHFVQLKEESALLVNSYDIDIWIFHGIIILTFEGYCLYVTNICKNSTASLNILDWTPQ
jgi:hypothetical protein